MKLLKFLFIISVTIIFASCESNDDSINKQNPVYNIPQQLEPPDNAIVSTLTPFMDWTDVQNAVSYRVQISFDEGYTQIVKDTSGITSSQYAVPAGIINDSSSYYWRVRAVTSTDSTLWSSTFSFSTLLESINPTNKVLVELFTNTSCVPCVDPNRYLDEIYKNQGVTSNDNNVIILRVHTTMFAGDPFYLYNTPDNDARMAFYPGTNISNPRGYLLGTYMLAYGASSWTNKINEKLSGTRPFAIRLVNTYDSVSRNGSVSIRIKQASGSSYSDLVYHCVLAENEIAYSAPNGETVFDNTMRDLITPSNGQSFSISTGQTNSYALNYNVASIINQNHSDLIVFVQRTSTKEVLAVERIKVK
jgi:thiol-disulfide isomerase/thioredoxin